LIAQQAVPSSSTLRGEDKRRERKEMRRRRKERDMTQN